MDGNDRSSVYDTQYELQFSIGKFFTYCSHLSEELSTGTEFSEVGFHGMGYIMLIRTHCGLPLSFGKGIDIVIDTLGYLLEQGYFDISYQSFSRAVMFVKELARYSDNNYGYLSTRLLERGKELYHSSGEKYRLTRESIHRSIDVSIRCYFDFEALLIKITDFYGSPYIENSERILHPSISSLATNFGTLLDRFEKWEIERYNQSISTGFKQGERFSDTEIIAWYENLKKSDIELQVLKFGVYLLTIGEFDTLPQRQGLVEHLLALAKKISPLYSHEIEAYINTSEFFTYSDEEVDKNIRMYTEEIIMSLYDGTLDDVRRCWEQFLDLLEEENIEIPEEIIEEKDLAKKVHELLHYLLVGNYFLYEDIKANVVDVLMTYYETRDRSRERDLIEFVGDENIIKKIISKEKKFHDVSPETKKTEILLLPPPHAFEPKKIKNALSIDPYWLDSLCMLREFLETLSFSENTMYIGEKMLHPKYTAWEGKIDDFIQMYKRFEEQYLDQAYRLGNIDSYEQHLHELALFYDSLVQEEDLIKKVCVFGSYLLQQGEFDTFEQRHEIQSFLVNIGKRFPNGIQDVAQNYIFPDEAEEFYIEIEGMVLNIIDSLIMSQTEDQFLFSHLENLLGYLVDQGVPLPEYFYQEKSILRVIHLTFIFLVSNDFIPNPKYREKIIQLSLHFFESQSTDEDSKIEISFLDYLRK